MAYHLHTEIKINATPAYVWSILMDTEKYPAWNPFINKVEGTFVVGQSISAKIGNMNFKPKVLVVTPEQELR